jgi:hypothetical protein
MLPKQLEKSKYEELRLVRAGAAGASGKQTTRRVVRGKRYAKKRERRLKPNLQEAANRQPAEVLSHCGPFPAARPLDGPDGSTDIARRSPNHGGASR